jgi:beta-phosphoglucomutase-like phosphatase (HAD superfamily)
MKKPPPPKTYEEAVARVAQITQPFEEAAAQVREQLRSHRRSGRPARTYEELVEEGKELIRHASNPKERAELEQALREFEAHAAKTAELRPKLAKLARRWDESNRISPFVFGMWLVVLPALVIIGIILANHYF